MRKLLLLPITLPLAMARGALEAGLHATADALEDLQQCDRGDGGGTVAGGPVAEAEVVDFDAGAAPPRRGPRPAPPSTAEPPRPAPTAREVAEDLGLEEGHTPQEPDELVESEGAGTAGAEVRVDEPWPGYHRLRAPDVVARLRTADDATKAVVRLYEQQHRARRTVLAATER